MLIVLSFADSFLQALPFAPGNLSPADFVTAGDPGADPRPVWLRVGTANDLFGGEYPINRDDGRSYGMNTAFGLGPDSGLWRGFALSIDWYGYTDRASELRADELGVFLSWARGLVPQRELVPRLAVSPALGFRIAGNTGGQLVQNLMHDVFNLAHADLTYDSEADGTTLFPELVLGLRVAGDLAIPLPHGARLAPGVSLEGEYSVPAGPRGRVDFDLALEHPAGDRFSLHAGWIGDLQDRGGTCIDTALNKESGFHIGAGLRTGLIHWQAMSYLEGGFSNGSISLLFNRPIGATGSKLAGGAGAAGGAGVPGDTAEADGRGSSGGIPLLFEYSLDVLAWERQIRLLVPLAGLSRGSFAMRASFDYSYGDANDDYASPIRRYRIVQGAPGFEAVLRLPFADEALEIAAGIDLGLRLEQDWVLPASISCAAGPLIQAHLALRTRPITLFPSSGIVAQAQRYGISAGYSLQYMPAPDQHIHLQHRLALGLIVSLDNAR